MSHKFKNKVIAITGAGRGIGRGIGTHLAKLGASIAAIDIDADGIAGTVRLVEESGSSARAYRCDITKEAEVEKSFAAIVSDFGRIDCLVNNAGIIRDGLLVKEKDGRIVRKLSSDAFDTVLDVCLKGAFLCAREASALMIEHNGDGGVIINISSGAFRGNYGQTNYSAAKAGLVAMSRVWAKELGKYNIRSMIIAPGAIETELLRSMSAEALDALARQIPLRRIGSIDNIASAIEQILENDYLSGSIMEVNGGMVV
ncbi:3-oxoacyl-[acyl-carrier protein] reductase [Rhodoligotrophos appendicifer]|uniref:SDR family oxidoreductase n=1 Tax=Rhodoligotrophos appendicifer TaxID=987056 RepID=UPI0011858B14|nr:SDR family oxidoreductase [Rhodoligotrophos appendicifer]